MVATRREYARAPRGKLITVMDSLVLHVITRLDAGGASANTVNSAIGVARHGFAAQMAYGYTREPRAALIASMRQAGIATHSVPTLIREPSPWHDGLALLQLINLIRRTRADLIHTHCSKAGALGRLAAVVTGRPVVHTPHGHVFYGYFGSARTALFSRIERLLAARTDQLISLTDDETREYLRRGIGTPEKYCTIASGIDLGEFQNYSRESRASWRAVAGIPASAMLFASTGRLVRVKGFDVLLDAFASGAAARQGAHLAIAGAGEERMALEAQAANRNIANRVHFCGDLPDVRPLLAASDIFVLASRNEGMGRSLVEAMAMGLPVVATGVGGIPQIVTSGRNGLLVAGDDAPALSAAMDTLAADAAMRRTLGSAARAAITNRYDWSTTADELASVYARVLAARGRRLARSAAPVEPPRPEVAA